MKISVLTFRDEFRPEPRQIVAFREGNRAELTRNFLDSTYRALLNSREPIESINRSWLEILEQQGIPSDRHFPIDPIRYSNVAFELKELELIE